MSSIVWGASNQQTLAAPFLKQAMELDALGKTSDALGWIKRGLELHPENSDLSFLKARILFSTQGPNTAPLLSSALSWSNFTTYRVQDASALYARVLRLQKRFDDAEAHLMGLWTTSDILNDRALLMEAVRLRNDMGLRGQAQALLERGLKINPSDLHLRALYLDIHETVPLGMALLVDRAKSDSPGYVELLRSYARKILPGTERLKLGETLKKMNSLDPWSVFLYLEDANVLARQGTDSVDQVSLVAQFMALGGAKDADTIAAFRQILDQAEASKALVDALSSMDREVFRDRERDGYREERYLLVKGNLSSWSLDQDQDGIVDYLSLWQEGSPVALILHDRTRNRYYRSEFGALYPYAGRTLMAAGPAVMEFLHDYRSMEERFVDLPDGGLDVFASLALAYDPQSLPQENDYLHASYQLNVYRARIHAAKDRVMAWTSTFIPLALPLPFGSDHGDYSARDFEITGSALAQYRLEDGLLVAGRVDEDYNGEFDHGFIYDKGRVAFGYRDLDGGTNATVVEEFDQKGLSRIVQSGMGWTYELLPGSGLALWDLNNDGLVDVREFSSGNGRVWQAFSTSGNGEFDLLLDGSR